MSFLAWRSRSNRWIYRYQLQHRCQTTTSTSSSSSIVLWTLPTLLVTGYVGGAYYAYQDETFKRYWLDYAPLASESLSLVEIVTKQDFQKSTQEAVAHVSQTWQGATTAVKEATQSMTTVAQQGYQKSVEWIETGKDNVNMALQTVSDTSSDVKKVLEKAQASVKEASHVVTETVHSVVDVASGKTSDAVDKTSVKEPRDYRAKESSESSAKDASPSSINQANTPKEVIPQPESTICVEVSPTETVAQEEEVVVPVSAAPLVVVDNTDLLTITQLVHQLPQESIARHLAESLSQLAFMLGDILSGVQSGSIQLDESAMQKVMTARQDLIRASEGLSGLQIEEATLIAQALEEQSNKFYAIVENQMVLHKKELEKQASDLKNSFDEAITQTRQELSTRHQKEMVELLADQASMLLTEFDQEMKHQAEKLDRRWEKEVKKRLDEEREGRLARLDHLALKLKLLEKMNLTVGEAVDRGQQVQTLWASVRALKDVLESHPHTLPFKQELALLKKATQHHSYPIVQQVVDTLSEEQAAFGVPTLVDVQTRFQSVAKAMRKAQFMPKEGGGPVSYLLSSVLSQLVFKKLGCVPGEDVEAVLARAEYYLDKGDVDSAARHVNQLKGTVGRMGGDWMKMARQYLHVRQALEVIETHLQLMDLNVL